MVLHGRGDKFHNLGLGKGIQGASDGSIVPQNPPDEGNLVQVGYDMVHLAGVSPKPDLFHYHHILDAL